MQQIWKNTAMGVVWSTLIWMVSSLLFALCSSVGIAGSFLFSGAGVFLVLAVLFFLGILAGFIWFLVSLSKFSNLQQCAADTATMKNVLTAELILIGANIVSIILSVMIFTAFIGVIISFIANIAIYAWLLTLYGSYSRSEVVGQSARDGASLLKTGCILALVAAVLNVIPFMGFISVLCNIAYIVLFFIGWTKISNGAPFYSE